MNDYQIQPRPDSSDDERTLLTNGAIEHLCALLGNGDPAAGRRRLHLLTAPPATERFPIQHGLTVSLEAAQRAYRAYARRYGTGQSLARLGERQGFGLSEFALLFWDRDTVSDREASIVSALARADVRVDPRGVV